MDDFKTCGFKGAMIKPYKVEDMLKVLQKVLAERE